MNELNIKHSKME